MKLLIHENVAVRPVRESDFECWKPLWDGYNAFYGRSGETALSPDVTRKTWGKFLDPQESMHAVVAEQRGQILGLAHFLFHQSTISANSNCYLSDLFTAEASRGRGIAKLLIEEVYRRAKTLGAGRVYWQTHETNATAMKLYDKVAEKSGFLVYRKML